MYMDVKESYFIYNLFFAVVPFPIGLISYDTMRDTEKVQPASTFAEAQNLSSKASRWPLNWVQVHAPGRFLCNINAIFYCLP